MRTWQFVLAVAVIGVLGTGAWTADWESGTVSVSWEVTPTGPLAVDQSASASVSANYDPEFPNNAVERVHGALSYSFDWSAAADGVIAGQSDNGNTSSSNVAFSTASSAVDDKTVSVTCTVTGTIECVGEDGEWDTDDEEYYTLEKSGTSPAANLTVVKLAGNESGPYMQFSLDSGETWDDVDETLFIAKGSTGIFKVFKEPEASGWPPGKPAWSGTSGASGTGVSKPVTFNTLSTSTTDYKTVTAECGNEVTANVIVFEVNIKHSDGESDPLEYLGFDGTLQLKAVPSPAGLAGSYTWSESSAKISLTNPAAQTVTVHGAEASSVVADAEVEVEFDPTGPGNAGDDALDVTVVKVDLRADGVGEETEESVGAFVGVDGTIQLRSQVSPCELPAGHDVVLTWDAGVDSKMEIYNYDRSVQIHYDSNNVWDPQRVQNPAMWYLFLDGKQASTTVRDIEFKWQYWAGGVMIHEDKAKVTVMKVELDIPADFPAYVPVGEELSMGSTVTPSGIDGIFTWSKLTGTGNVAFDTSGSEDPAFSADAAGEYTVKVSYSKGGETVEDTSGTIVVYTGIITVRRSGSGSGYASTAAVAAGAINLPVHKADIQVAITPVLQGVALGFTVGTKSGEGDGREGTNGAAVIVMNSYTPDAAGKIYGTFTSSNRTENVTIECQNGEGSPITGFSAATVEQKWDTNTSDNWQSEPYFFDEEWEDVSFTCKLTDSASTVPITGHNFDFYAWKVDYYEWNEYLFDYVPVSEAICVQNEWDISWASEFKADQEGTDGVYATQDAANGVYETQQIVHVDEDWYWFVDKIYFVAIDQTVYK